MKYIKNLSLLGILCAGLMVGVSSCSDDDKDNATSSTSKEDIVKNFKFDGTWKSEDVISEGRTLYNEFVFSGSVLTTKLYEAGIELSDKADTFDCIEYKLAKEVLTEEEMEEYKKRSIEPDYAICSESICPYVCEILNENEIELDATESKDLFELGSLKFKRQ